MPASWTQAFRNTLRRLTGRFSSESPLMILPYRGYAGPERLFLKGRVLEKQNILWQPESRWRTLLNSYRRLKTDEIPFARVEVQVGDQAQQVTADREGYFSFETEKPTPEPGPQNRWKEVRLRLLQETAAPVEAEAEILIPSQQAEYGIITDVDDTVLQTHVTSRLRLKMLYTTFLKHAGQRLPMEGVVELYQAFEKGTGQAPQNPIFYVSNSPWNLYDLLERFMDLQELPKGPILLRDFGLKPAGPFSNHKPASISHILQTLPHLPFIMLGDTASKDADFYLQLAKEYPGRIRAIYIRQTRNNRNARRVARLIQEHAHMNAVLVRSSREIKEHAREMGLIEPVTG